MVMLYCAMPSRKQICIKNKSTTVNFKMFDGTYQIFHLYHIYISLCFWDYIDLILIHLFHVDTFIKTISFENFNKLNLKKQL